MDSYGFDRFHNMTSLPTKLLSGSPVIFHTCLYLKLMLITNGTVGGPVGFVISVYLCGSIGSDSESLVIFQEVLVYGFVRVRSFP